MTGDRSSFQQRGLIPRTISELITQLRADPGLASWQLRVSYLEIYNEAIFDLLDITTQPHEITLHEDGRGRLAVAGLRAADVRSEQEALALFFEGEANRVIGEHQLNRESSRSHCVFMLSLALEHEGASDSGGDSGNGGGRGTVSSKISLVDLAGSERVSKTRSEGLVLKEAGHINKSLHILEQVVLAASERGRDHVPYRSCKLTHVLKDSIGGNCRAVLVANVWGDASQLEETLSTCRFAARMARVACEVTRNVAQEGGARVKQLEREVSELLEELAMHDLWAGRGEGAGTAGASADAIETDPAAAARARYTPYTRAQRVALLELVQRFLSEGDGGGDADGGGAGEDGGGGGLSLADLGISSMRRLREVMLACRVLYQEALSGQGAAAFGASQAAARAGAGQLPGGPATAAPMTSQRASGSGGGDERASAGAEAGWHEYIGDEEDGGASQSGGAGVAPDDARPGSTAQGQQQQQQQWQGGGSQWAAGPGPGSDVSAWPQQAGAAAPLEAAPAAPADAAAALELYRRGPGAEKAQLLNENHSKARASKRAARELALRLNSVKEEIDGLREGAAGMKAARLALGDEEAQVASLEELEVLEAIRDAKARYRDAHGELQLARSEAEYAAGLLDACRRELAAEFEAWWAAQQQRQAGSGAAGHDNGGGGGDRGPGAAAAASGSGLITSRRSSAVSSSSMLLGGLPSPAGLASPAPRTPEDRSASPLGAFGSLGPRRRGGGSSSGGGVPLASIVVAAAAEADAQGDSAAAAYFHAQQAATWRMQGGGAVLRPGSAKKHRGERGTFSMTQRGVVTGMPGSR